MGTIKNFILKYLVKFKIIFFIYGVVGSIVGQFLYHKPLIGTSVALSALGSLIFVVYIYIKELRNYLYDLENFVSDYSNGVKRKDGE